MYTCCSTHMRFSDLSFKCCLYFIHKIITCTTVCYIDHKNPQLSQTKPLTVGSHHPTQWLQECYTQIDHQRQRCWIILRWSCVGHIVRDSCVCVVLCLPWEPTVPSFLGVIVPICWGLLFFSVVHGFWGPKVSVWMTFLNGKTSQ